LKFENDDWQAIRHKAAASSSKEQYDLQSAFVADADI
jgi:hypothetical protein